MIIMEKMKIMKVGNKELEGKAGRLVGVPKKTYFEYKSIAYL